MYRLALGYLRCDAFELLESDALPSLQETVLDGGAAQLLIAVLKNNRTLTELDLLTATDLSILRLGDIPRWRAE